MPEDTLFIHGNIASNAWWYSSLEYWRKKNRNNTGKMILAEWRGCGQSSVPSSKAEVNMHTFANDYIKLIEELNLKKINVVGHSTGGLIAALAMAQRPDLFSKAVLLDPVGLKGIHFEPSMSSTFEAMKTDRNLVAQVLHATIYQNDINNLFFQSVLVEDAQKAVNHLSTWVLEALTGIDVRGEIAQINLPTLVLHGEFDQLLPVEDSNVLAKTLRNGQFHILKDCGHCANIENVERFCQTTEAFLFN